MSSYTTVLQCLDTYINASDGATHSSEASLKIGGYYSTTPTRKKYAAVLGFDLSSIPPNKMIKKLNLNYSVQSFAVYYINNYDVEVDEGQKAYHLSQYPFVLKARTALGYTNSEINNLNYGNVITKTFDPFANITYSHDTSMSLANKEGQNVSMDIGMIDYTMDESGNQTIVNRRPTNNIVTVLLIQDTAFSNGGYGTGVYLSSSPSLTVTYEDYVPSSPYNLTPNTTTRNKSGEIKLSWEYSDGGTGAIQSSAEVLYSTDGFATSTTKTVSNSQNYHTVPANIFQVGQTVQWKVRVTDTNGDVSSYSSIASFSLGSTLPSAAELINPYDTIVNSSDTIIFKWKFVDNYGYTQGGFDFAYAKDNGVETVIHVNTAVPQYAMPKESLWGGNYKWRVRCYNEFGEVGVYSDFKNVYSIGKPNAPSIIEVSNNCRPVVRWNATEQDLYIIRLVQGSTEIYNSGEQISGTENLFQIPIFLVNGTYSIGIKTSNVYGFWSNETSYTLTVNTVKPSVPNMVASVLDNKATIIIDSETVTNILYKKKQQDKEYLPIVELSQNSYTDYKIDAGETQYFVRAISVDAFADSVIKKVELDFRGIIIANDNDLSNMINLYTTLDGDNRKSVSIARDSYKINCVGRKYPITQRTEFRSYVEAHEYFLKEDDYRKFEEIINESNIVFYRNKNGTSFFSEVSNVSVKENTFGYVITFTLTKLDRS